MLVSEFIDRTGYRPDADEYKAIEREYNSFRGDKDQFCRAWGKANPTKYGQIWKAQKSAAEHEKEVEKTISIVLKYVSSKKTTTDAIDRDTFTALFANVSDKVKREVIFGLNTWHGFTSGWSCEKWAKYWNLHACCACGW